MASGRPEREPFRTAQLPRKRPPRTGTQTLVWRGLPALGPSKKRPPKTIWFHTCLTMPYRNLGSGHVIVSRARDAVHEPAGGTRPAR